MNRFRKLKIVAMAMLALLLVLTACSGGKSSNSGSSSGGSSAGTSETSGGNAQSGGDAQSGGGKSGESVLRVALPLNPRIIGYPAEVTNNGPLPFLDPVVQSLLHFDEKGNHVPWLAESWETDAEAATITFKLKQGIKFHDGTDFNAEAVKWNIEQYIENKRTETENIASMEVIDDHTLLIRLKDWNSSSLEAIGFFVRHVSPTAVQANGKEWAYTNPVGTGPFLLDQWNMNVSVTYKKNPDYWEPGEPKVDRIELLIIEDANTAASALRAGEVDLIQAGNVDLADELIKSGEFDYVLQKNGIGAVGVGLIPDSVTEGSPFADVRVRKAMAHAIDEVALAETFGKGYWETTNQWGSREAYTFNPEVEGFPYDPEKAKQLLAEAGYPNGFKTKLFSGLNTKDVFTAIQSYLAQVGIDAELIVVDEAQVQSLYFSTWEGGLMGHFHSVQPDLGLYMFRHLDPNGAFYAKGIIHPEDVLELLRENQKAPNMQVKTETSHKLQKLVYDEYAIVGKPLYIPMGIFIKQKYVKDDGFGVTHNAFWTPDNVWLDK
jgi:ABC-type transport system substrate-binding protein